MAKKRRIRTGKKKPGGDKGEKYSVGELFLAALGLALLILVIGMVLTTLIGP